MTYNTVEGNHSRTNVACVEATGQIAKSDEVNDLALWFQRIRQPLFPPKAKVSNRQSRRSGTTFEERNLIRAKAHKRYQKTRAVTKQVIVISSDTDRVLETLTKFIDPTVIPDIEDSVNLMGLPCVPPSFFEVDLDDDVSIDAIFRALEQEEFDSCIVSEPTEIACTTIPRQIAPRECEINSISDALEVLYIKNLLDNKAQAVQQMLGGTVVIDLSPDAQKSADSIIHLLTSFRNGGIKMENSQLAAITKALESIKVEHSIPPEGVNIHHKIDPAFMAKMDDLSIKLDLDFTSSFNALLSFMKEDATFSFIKSFVGDIIRILLALFMMYNEKDTKRRIFIMTATALTLNISLTSLTSFIYAFTRSVAQGISSESWSFFLNLMGLKEMPFHDAAKSARDISAHLNLFKDFAKFVTFLTNQIRDLSTWIHDVDTIEDKEYDSMFDELHVWTKKIQDLYSSDLEAKLADGSLTSKQWDALREEGKKHLVVLSRSRTIPSQMSVTFHRMIQKMDEMDARMMAFNIRSNIRPKPIFVWIYGTTSQGKSRLITALARSIFEEIYPDRKNVPDSEICYWRNVADDYFSGYNNQLCCVWDDPFQQNDYEVWRQIQSDLLHFGDATPRKLNMAELEKKAGTYFRSHFIFVSTNTTLSSVLKQAPIECPAALIRRVDFNLELTLDKAKQGFAAWEAKLLRIDQKDPDYKTVVERTLNMPELLDEILKARDSNISEEEYFKTPIFKIPRANQPVRANQQMEGSGKVEDDRIKYDAISTKRLNDEHERKERILTELYAYKEAGCPPSFPFSNDIHFIPPPHYKDLTAGGRFAFHPELGLQAKAHFRNYVLENPYFKPPFLFVNMSPEERFEIQNLNFSASMLTHDFEKEPLVFASAYDLPSVHDSMALIEAPSPPYLKCINAKQAIPPSLIRGELVNEPYDFCARVPSLQFAKTDTLDGALDNLDSLWKETYLVLPAVPLFSFLSPITLFRWVALQHFDEKFVEIFLRRKIGAIMAPTGYLMAKGHFNIWVKESTQIFGPFVMSPFAIKKFREFNDLFGYEMMDTIMVMEYMSFPEYYRVRHLTYFRHGSDTLSEWNKYMAYDWKNLKKTARKYAKPVLVTAAVLGVVYAGYKLMSSSAPTEEVQEEKEEEIEFDEASYRTKHQSEMKDKKHTPVQRKEYKRTSTRPKQQMAEDTDAIQCLEKVAHDNLCRIARFCGGVQVGPSVHAIFVQGPYALAPAHFFYLDLYYDQISFFFDSVQVLIDRNKIETRPLGDDLMFIDVLDKTFQPRKNIVSMFMPESSLKRIHGGTVSVPIFNNKMARYVLTGTFGVATSLNYDCTKPFGETTQVLMNGIKANLPTTGGNCGAPYFIQDPKFQAKIFALHIAGVEAAGIAYGHLISREEINDAIMESQACPAAQSEGSMEWPDRFVFVRKAEPLEINYPPRATQLVPTPLKDVFGPCTMFPARLSKFTTAAGERLDPMYLALVKMNKHLPIWSPEDLDLFDQVLEGYFEKKPLPKTEVRDFTLHEAINGLPNEPYFGRISLNSSPGNYWRAWMAKDRKRFPQQSRRNLFICQTCSSVCSCLCFPSNLTPIPELLESIEKSVDMLAAGEIPDWLFEILLKDELRDKERVDAGKTRIFGNGPLELYIVYRMYYGAYLLDEKKQHGENLVAVGLNPHSPQWGDVVRRIAPTDNHKFIAGDLSGQDVSQQFPQQMIKAEHITKWYQRYAQKQSSMADSRRSIMIRCGIAVVAHSPNYVLYDDVVNIDGINPSGWGGTGTVNHLDNIAVHGVCAIKHFRKNPLPGVSLTPRNFLDYFLPIVMGDDHVIGTTLPNYTHVDVQREHAALGYTYTAPDKSEVVDRLYDLTEVSFLQRKFRKDGPYYFAPLEIDKIKQICYWRTKSTPLPVAISSAFQAMLLEFFHHGKDIYNEWKEKLLVLWKQQRFNTQLPIYSYDELLFKYSRGILEDPWAPGFSAFPAYHTMAIEQMEKEDNMIENTSTVSAQLTKVTDAEEVVESADAETPFNYGSFDPYVMDTTPVGMLDRQYEIASFNWSSTAALGDNLYVFRLPYDYFASITLAREVAFRYGHYSFDIELEFRLNTTIYHRGLLSVAYVPLYNPGASFFVGRASTYQSRWAGANITLLDASTKNPVSVVAPMISPFTAYLTSWIKQDTYGGIGGSIYVDVMSPLTRSDITTPTTSKVIVYARLKKPKVFGPNGSEMIFQMIDRPRQQMDIDDRMISASKKKDALMTEAKKKTTGRLSTVADSVGDVAASLAVIPQLSAPMSAVSAISKLVGIGAASFGNSKTRDIEGSTFVTPSAFPHSSLASGVNLADMMALTTDARIGSTSLFPDDVDYDLWVNYGMRPAYHSQFPISTTNVHGEELVKFKVTPAHRNGTVTTPQLMQSMFATHWRGSMQYQLDFCAASTDNFRVRIVYTHPGSEDALITDTTVGDFVTHLVDVQGRTTFRFSVPYLGNAHYAYTGSPSEDLVLNPTDLVSGWITVLLDIPLQTFGSTASAVNCVIHYACGPDMQFAVPRKPWARPVSGATQQTDVGDTLHLVQAFRETFPALIDASPVALAHHGMSETIPSWSAIFRRPHFVASYTLGGTSTTKINLGTVLFATSHEFAWMGAIFQCLRGSLVATILPLYNCEKRRFYAFLNNSPSTASTNVDWTNGGVYSDFVTRQVISVQIPQYQRGLFMTGNWINYFFTPAYLALSVVPDGSSDATNASVSLLISVGDDFTLAMPSSLPRWVAS